MAFGKTLLISARLNRLATFIGLPHLINHFRKMPLGGHLANLSVALLIGYIAVALKICSYQPGDLADRTATPPGAATPTAYPDWAGEAGIAVAPASVTANLDDIRSGAEDGDSAAQFQLAWAYHTGTRVPRDLVEAYRWLLLAGRNVVPDHPYTAAARRLSAELTERQAKEARRLARAWLDKHGNF